MTDTEQTQTIEADEATGPTPCGCGWHDTTIPHVIFVTANIDYGDYIECAGVPTRLGYPVSRPDHRATP